MSSEALLAGQSTETRLAIAGETSVEIVAYTEAGELTEQVTLSNTDTHPHPDVAMAAPPDISSVPLAIDHLSLSDEHVVIQAPISAKKPPAAIATVTQLPLNSHSSYGRSREQAHQRRAA